MVRKLKPLCYRVLESSMQKALTNCGTPYYMSPEIHACKPYNSKVRTFTLILPVEQFNAVLCFVMVLFVVHITIS